MTEKQEEMSDFFRKYVQPIMVSLTTFGVTGMLILFNNLSASQKLITQKLEALELEVAKKESSRVINLQMNALELQIRALENRMDKYEAQ